MSVRITSAEDVVALFCSTTGFAFGPTFDDEDAAQEFLDWYDKHEDRDPRLLSDGEMEALHTQWLTETGRAE